MAKYYGLMKLHRCRHPICEAHIDARYLMCISHWTKMPYQLQHQMRRAASDRKGLLLGGIMLGRKWRPQSHFKTHGWFNAVKACIQYYKDMIAVAAHRSQMNENPGRQFEA